MGLTDLPRQIAGFPEFRRAMLFSIKSKNNTDAWELIKYSLAGWKGKQTDDLGIMLLEMWAYVCDTLCFYDKVIAQEEYIRTALRRPSLRKLVGLLGYLPRPAVGSTAWLTALAEGRLILKIPSGTAFRSTGFNGNPPQVFELEEDKNIHPLTNRFNIKPPVHPFASSVNPSGLLVLPRATLKEDFAYLMIDAQNNYYSQGVWVTKAADYIGTDNKKYKFLSFLQPATIPALYALSNFNLQIPAQTAGLWTLSAGSVASDFQSVVLDTLQRQIKSGQYILLGRNKELRWFRVTSVTEEIRQQSAFETVQFNNVNYKYPGLSTQVSRIWLDASINSFDRKKPGATDWSDADRSFINVYFAFSNCADTTNDPSLWLSPADPIAFTEKAEQPIDNYDPMQFYLTDKNGSAAKVNGRINFSASNLILDMDEGWNPNLVLPVELFGNLIKTTRGETVPNEILGSGDATVINQTYKLKKKPLSYYPAPTVDNDQGVQNELKVYVDNIRRTEVPSFFNRNPEESIYIVRQDDEGESYVTFGDGLRGRRLTSGTDNIVATYRYGAEQATPPATTINQISKPVKGLTSVNNPQGASGGADREGPEGLRTYAPKSILTLGRIVSIQDVEAVAGTVAGIRAVQVEWRWQEEKQAPMIHIWYIGEAGIEETLNKRIRGMADPSLVLQIELASPRITSINIDVQIDEKYVEDKVLANLRTAYTNTSTGLLAPEVLGIGRPVFRSRIFETALDIDGVVAVHNILWNGETLESFAKTPGAGYYFDFENGEILINEST